MAFTLGRVTFRTELYPEYKAHRDETPDDIRKATPVIKDILRAMNIPILEVEGYEADDIIGTIAHRGPATRLHHLHGDARQGLRAAWLPTTSACTSPRRAITILRFWDQRRSASSTALPSPRA